MLEEMFERPYVILQRVRTDFYCSGNVLQQEMVGGSSMHDLVQLDNAIDFLFIYLFSVPLL